MGRSCPQALAEMGPRGSQAGQGTGGSTSTKGVSVTPNSPQPQFTLKGCVHSRPKPTKASLPQSGFREPLVGRQGWGTRGKTRSAHTNADPLPALPQLGSQPCHRLSPEAQGPWSLCSRGSGGQGWGSWLQEGARGRGSSQRPCRDCRLSELQGTGPGPSQVRGLEGLVLSQVFTEEGEKHS